MQQILFLHGGESYDTYENYTKALRARTVNYDRLKYHPRWREWIATQLPHDDILTPTMPNSDNAVYDEWVIYFNKIIKHLAGDVTIVGHSLGGMFLANYLHTHVLPHKVQRVILVAARYGGTDKDCGSFCVNSAIGVERSAKEVHLVHAKDDPIVPYADVDKFAKDIPSAIVHKLEAGGHFIDETFPEMLELLKKK